MGGGKGGARKGKRDEEEREAKARRDDESGRSGSAGAGGRRRKTKFSERRVGRRENERGRKREQRGKQDEPVAGDGSPIGGRARHGERFRDLVELMLHLLKQGKTAEGKKDVRKRCRRAIRGRSENSRRIDWSLLLGDVLRSSRLLKRRETA